MQSLALPLTREVVLIGGGHTHALLLRAWGMNHLPGARLTLINPGATAPYTGMLPGFIAGHYDRDALEIDLVRLARLAGARILFDRVTGIDRRMKQVNLAGRPPINYDVASFDIGVTSSMPEVPGFEAHGIAAKPLGPFATRWRAHLDTGGGDVAVIGGGVAGVELALAMAFALDGRGKVSIIEADAALSGVSEDARGKLLDEVKRAGIALYDHRRVNGVKADRVVLDDGQEVPAVLTVGAAGARPFEWLEDTGLALTDGYIAVRETLRSESDNDIFAVGDCAHLSKNPRPKAGVFAVRAAPVLTANIRAALTGSTLRPFTPQKRYLKLISLGRKAALADKWNRALVGNWVWRWKDWIDQRFMTKLAELPEMEADAAPVEIAEGADEVLGAKPLCGGCGSKVGAEVLGRVLDGTKLVERPDVEVGHGDDAAVLKIANASQVITTDHLRAFWNDPRVFARIAALHALGDIWAMGATPQAALAQIILPPLSPRLQEAWLSEIMDAASEVFQDEGVAVAGGHTTQGAEMTVGFTLTGLIGGSALTLSGAQAGDALILTRPVGSGVLLAGEMAGTARGDDVEALLRVLQTSQGDAARVLAKVATAMTDVTGFGLAGHLARMAEASALSAVVTLKDVPVFEGAEGLAAKGTKSTIFGANRQIIRVEIPTTAKGDLLFDPQTAGGLLAAVPEPHAAAALDACQKMGHEAAIIGQFQPQEAFLLRAT